MALTLEEALKELRNSEEIYVAYSRATNLPYITEGEETFSDQVWLFSTEEEIKQYGKKLLDDRILIMGMKYEKKDFPRMYGLFYAIGADAIVWNKGEDRIEVEMSKLVREPDMSNVEANKRPMMNATLQLAGIYFMQELRRPLPKDASEEDKKARTAKLRELDEQLVANLRKSEFLLAMNQDAEDPKKISIPYLKNKEGKMLQPAFSDAVEFQKFAKGKKYRIVRAPFAKLIDLMIEQAEAVVINPMGFNLGLNREQLKKINGFTGDAQ